MTEVGLYFGSFNPIHIGHLAIAGYITEFTETSQVWFVVSPHNPLKKKETLLDDYQRLHMVRLSIEKNDKLKACDIEFHLPVPSYTTDTLAHLTEKHPGHRFSLVMGEDNLYTLHKWKNAANLVSRHRIYVYPRRGSVKPDSPLLDTLLKAGDINFVDAPVMELSGTFIRDGLRKGRDMSYYLPPAVWKYIDEMNFYRK